jgi:hypothetical protein
LDNFLLKLFDKYAELLKKRFSEDFQEVSFSLSTTTILSLLTCLQIVSTDDYMPMAINNPEEYEKVVNVSWFSQEKPTDQIT